MLKAEDYPVFIYFFRTYIYDFVKDFTDLFSQANKFGKETTHKRCAELKAEIFSLKKKETWEVQSFMVRQFGVRFKQKEIPIILDALLNGLESK